MVLNKEVPGISYNKKFINAFSMPHAVLQFLQWKVCPKPVYLIVYNCCKPKFVSVCSLLFLK